MQRARHIGMDRSRSKTIPSQFIKTLVSILAEHPLEKTYTLKYLGVEDLDTMDDISVHEDRVNALLIYLYETRGIKDIGLRLGHEASSGAYGVLTYLMFSCNSFDEAINELINHYNVVSFFSSFSPTMHTDIEDHFVVQLDQGSSNTVVQRIKIDAQLTALSSVFSLLAGNTCVAQSINISDPNTNYAHLYSPFFNCETTFTDQPTSISYRIEWLSKTLPSANKDLKRVFKAEIELLRKKTEDEISIIDQVMMIMDNSNNLAEISIETVASQLFKSDRTLKRQLQTSGTNFRNILNQYKQSKAIEMLAKDNHSLDHIANYLGFSERSAFERAFKGWLTLTPTQFRRQMQASQLIDTPSDMLDPKNIPTASESTNNLINIINNHDHDVDNLRKAIEQDTILTANLVSLANSSFYSANSITDLKEAITRAFSITEAQNLSLSMEASNNFDLDKVPAFSKETYWVKALAMSNSLLFLSKKSEQLLHFVDEGLHLTGLLHNIGTLLFVHAKPNESRKVIDDMHLCNSSDSIKELETLTFGVNHYTAGSALLASWNLPDSVVNLIRNCGEDIPDDELYSATEAIRFLSTVIILIQQDNYPSDEQIEHIANILTVSFDDIKETVDYTLEHYNDYRQTAANFT